MASPTEGLCHERPRSTMITGTLPKEATSSATSPSCNVYYKREQIRRRALRAV